MPKNFSNAIKCLVEGGHGTKMILSKGQGVPEVKEEQVEESLQMISVDPNGALVRTSSGRVLTSQNALAIEVLEVKKEISNFTRVAGEIAALGTGTKITVPEGNGILKVKDIAEEEIVQSLNLDINGVHIRTFSRRVLTEVTAPNITC